MEEKERKQGSYLTGPSISARALIASGSARPASLGVTAADLTPQMARDYALSIDKGAIILQVEPGSPAARAGVRPGDIITEAENVPVDDAGDLARAIGAARPGQIIALEILARDGELRTAEVQVVRAD